MLSGQGRSANSQQTHEMTVPNELIGCIIGKGGSKVAEIRCVFIPAMMGVQLVPFLKLKEMFISSPQKICTNIFHFTTLHCLSTTIRPRSKLSNWDLTEISFDIWTLGVMICLSNFCICISSQEFPYFKHCRPLWPISTNFTQTAQWREALYIAICMISPSYSYDEINLSFHARDKRISVLTSSFQIFAKYFPNIQTTLGGNDPNLKLRRPGRPGQPGQDDQHHGEHGVGGVGPVLDQHEVGWDPSSLFARCPVPTTQSKAWHIAKHQTYRSIIYPLANIYLYTVHIYIQTCLGCSKLWL